MHIECGLSFATVHIDMHVRATMQPSLCMTIVCTYAKCAHQTRTETSSSIRCILLPYHPTAMPREGREAVGPRQCCALLQAAQ